METYSEYAERTDVKPVKSEEIKDLAEACELSLSHIFGENVFPVEWISPKMFSIAVELVEEREDGFFDIYLVQSPKMPVKIQAGCDYDAVVGFFDYVPHDIKPFKKQ